MSLPSIASRRDKRPTATLTEGFLEIFTSLVSLKHIRTLSQVLNLEFPANFTLTVNVPAPLAQVVLITESLITLNQDNVFSINVVVDNESKYSDSSMLMNRYNDNPLNFLRLGALYPSSGQIAVTLTNLTNAPQSMGIWLVGGIIDRTLWNDLVQLYFRSLLTELGLSL